MEKIYSNYDHLDVWHHQKAYKPTEKWHQLSSFHTTHFKTFACQKRRGNEGNSIQERLILLSSWYTIE